MTYFKTLLQYLCVGILFGLVGFVYSLLPLAGLTGLRLNISTFVLVVLVFLVAQKLCRYIERPGTGQILLLRPTPVVGWFGVNRYLADASGSVTAVAGTTTTASQTEHELFHVGDYLSQGNWFLNAERIQFQTEQNLRLAIDVMMRAPSGLEHTLQETCLQTLAGSYSKSTVVLPPSSVDVISFLNFTDLQTKTRAEMIELQRKPLDSSAESTLSHRMLLSGIPQHG